ncbi:hypothetical protein [Chachezhania antarctica]|uniref:hypothetical protein n=1 Tax=Chachezhania antarctica TaxID=2340860 RepID=UPI0013CEB18B|nr:hypothetical protein [Chachezhania antarctica]
MSLRRKLALLLCPDLAVLPYDRPLAPRLAGPELAEAAARAKELCRLDLLYAVRTGVVLTWSNAPQYEGPMYQWPHDRQRVRRISLGALERLRKGKQQGVRPITAFMACNYFSAIWPADLAWPADIPRPPKSNPQEAA